MQRYSLQYIATTCTGETCIIHVVCLVIATFAALHSFRSFAVSVSLATAVAHNRKHLPLYLYASHIPYLPLALLTLHVSL
jgi:hypothetical protein